MLLHFNARYPFEIAGKLLSVILILIIGAGCAGTSGQFSEGLRVMAGKGGTEEKTDSLKEIVPIARQLAAYQPKPVWQTMLKADETDIVEFISKDRLLIGMLQRGGFFQKSTFSRPTNWKNLGEHNSFIKAGFFKAI